VIRACVLNSSTKEVENIIMLDSLDNFVPYKAGIELATQHDGEIGWAWGDNGWVTPVIPETTLEERKNIVREKRNGLLRRHVDIMNGIRWESLPEENKQEYRDYRQSLLDITEQEGFPDSVVWPEKPNI
jgi:hypothetical protein